MHDPIGIARIFEARRQAFGNLEPLFDRRQQQNPGIRGQPAAVEPDMHRLARHGWQAWQNPRIFPHGGRELRWPRLTRPSNQIIHETNGLIRSRRPFQHDLMNYSG